MTRRILITGGAGFIGWHLADHLARDPGNQITIVDDLSRGRFDHDLRKLIAMPNVHFKQSALTSVGSLLLIGSGDDGRGSFDDIYHLAAINGTRRFYEMPADVLENNLLSTLAVLGYARSQRAIHPPRILFTSSNEAYAGALETFGQLPIPTPETVPLVIGDTYNPRWSYGGSKLAGELLMIAFAKQHGIPVVIVRPHNFYGPRAGTEHVIPGLLAKIYQQQDPLQVPGADETRSFCYIRDAVDAMARVIEKASVDAPTFHIGSGEEITIRDLAHKLLRLTGNELRWVSGGPGLPGSVKRRCPSVLKIEAEIGWTATTPLETGLAETIRWYHDHR